MASGTRRYAGGGVKVGGAPRAAMPQLSKAAPLVAGGGGEVPGLAVGGRGNR